MTEDTAPGEMAPSGANAQALFLDGTSLAELPVRVELGTALRIIDLAGTTLADWSVGEIRCEQREAASSSPVHVTHGGHADQHLIVTDVELGRAVLELCPAARPQARASSVRAAVFWLVALVSLGAGVYASVPTLAHAVATRIPLEQERALGAQIEVLLDFARCSDRAADQALAELVRKLSARESAGHEIRIVKASEPNAFALPGGLIIVTSALLHEAETADEIAGVVAHEIEHVVQRHVLSGFLRDALLSAAWAITIGDYTGLLVVDPTTAYRIANLKFSRGDEQSADDAAVRRLHRAGIDHAGLVEFFARLGKEHGDGTAAWLSTHPTHSERTDRLRRTPAPKQVVSALSDDQLAALRKACDASGKTAR